MAHIHNTSKKLRPKEDIELMSSFIGNNLVFTLNGSEFFSISKKKLENQKSIISSYMADTMDYDGDDEENDLMHLEIETNNKSMRVTLDFLNDIDFNLQVCYGQNLVNMVDVYLTTYEVDNLFFLG